MPALFLALACLLAWVPAASAQSSWEIVQAAALRWGVSPQLAHALVDCESDYRPRAIGAAGERGLFQLAAGTWAAYAPAYGVPADFGAAFDPWLNAEVAMGMIANGGLRHWAGCVPWWGW